MATVADISVDQVELAFRTDTRFAELSEQEVQAILPYVRRLPAILADQLDAPLSLEVLVRSLAAYYKTLASEPEDFLANYQGDERDMAETALEVFEMMAEQLEAQLPALATVIAHADKTETTLIIEGPPALCPEAADLLRHGELTLGRLLLIQPGVIAIPQKSQSTPGVRRRRHR